MNASGPTIEHRDVRCSHSPNLPDLLAQLRLSVLISTYQTGHVVVVAARNGRLVVTFHLFDRAMGVAIKPGCLAVCTRNEVWFLRSAPDIAARLEPIGQHDACFLARTAQFTGDLKTHEAAWVGNEFWFVNTLFSCLATLHPYYSFAPRWRPPFVSALHPEDRCHLNGLGLVDGQPRYVTALGQADTPAGWRDGLHKGGCVVEVPSGRLVAGGLSMPHSPRVHDGRLYILTSGDGRLDTVDPASGQVVPVAEVPGVGRGLALQGDYAFIGLSKPRPSLEGVPIVAHREQLKCGLAVVELRTGNLIAQLEFVTGVEEVFDVQLLPGIAFPYISGPMGLQDTGQPLWTISPGPH